MKERRTMFDLRGEIERIKRELNPSDEVMKLVESDLLDGIPYEDVKRYVEGRYSIRWMTLISECLRAGVPREAVEKLYRQEWDINKPDTISILYENGVPAAVLEQSFRKAGTERRLMEILLAVKEASEKKASARKESGEKQHRIPDRTQAGTEHENPQAVKTVMEESGTTDKSADESGMAEKDIPKESGMIGNDNLKKSGTMGMPVEYGKPEGQAGSDSNKPKGEGNESGGVKGIKDDPVERAAEKPGRTEDDIRMEYTEALAQRDAVISSQQDRINEANYMVKKLQAEKVTILAEKEDYERKVQDLEAQLSRMEEQIRVQQAWKKPDQVEYSEAGTRQEKENRNGYTKDSPGEGSAEKRWNWGNDHLVQETYYIPNGEMEDRITVEKTVRNSSALGKILSSFIKKRSRRSLVRLAIEGKLDKEQLAGISAAVKCRLTEDQLCQLIENRVPADRMKELIEIAVLENQMGYNG